VLEKNGNQRHVYARIGSEVRFMRRKVGKHFDAWVCWHRVDAFRKWAAGATVLKRGSE
jgi:hypothetical protein